MIGDEEEKVLDWVRRETARRAREEDPNRPANLRPLEEFSDEYADPARYETVDQARIGPKSATIQGLINLDCSGWVRRPTSEECYKAMRAEAPTERQESITGIVLRANFWDIVGAWMEAGFTWRQLARAMSRRSWQEPELVHDINGCATWKS